MNSLVGALILKGRFLMKIKSTFAAASAAVIIFGSVLPVSAAIPLWAGKAVHENGGMVQNASHWVRKCTVVRIKTTYGWKKVKKCKRVRARHSSGYY
jgi:hypothetical protein